MCDCKTETKKEYATTGIDSGFGSTNAQYAAAEAQGINTAGLYRDPAHMAELRGENNVRKQIISDHAAAFKAQLDKMNFGLARDVAKMKIDEAEFWALKCLEKR